MDHFLKTIIQEKEVLAIILNHIKPIIMTPQHEEDFQKAIDCYLYRQPLFQYRYKGHDHLSDA